jgi:drug/metabolite transporter (DMT)-like permease
MAIRKGSGLARGATLFSIGSALVAIVIGVLIYKEPISRVEQIGLVFGVVAIILLSSPEFIN